MRHSRQRIHILEQRATQMRHAPTASEAKLFEALRGGRLGRHLPEAGSAAGRFIADPRASEVKLVVKVDGGYHAARERADARRDRALAQLGLEY